MEKLFSSPIFTGGGHAHHRSKETKPARVWHDAAYFAPLLWYYHQACREEICGLRVDEVAFVEAAEQCKRELGIVETADDVEAMRSKGGNRTQAKRDFLGRMQERAREVDREAVRAYF